MKFLKWSICLALKQIEKGLILIYQIKPDDQFRELLLEFMYIKNEIIKKLKNGKKNQSFGFT